MAFTFTRSLKVLSILIIIFTIAASAGGLFIKGLYRDNAFVTSTWLGTDFVTLCLAVPLLIAAAILAGRGSTRAYLICLGLFESSLYNFGFYLFGAAFNILFMVYAALFGLSIWALFLGLKNLDIEKLSKLFRPRTPVKVIGAFMIFIGLGLGIVYISQWLGFVMTGKLPDIIIKTAHPTNVVFGLDLSLVVPLFIIGGIWLCQRKPWGFGLAAIANVKGAVYMAGLCAATWTAFKAGTVKDLSEIALWGAIGIGCLISALVLLTNLKKDSSKPV